jgi:hypothetical protein
LVARESNAILIPRHNAANWKHRTDKLTAVSVRAERSMNLAARAHCIGSTELIGRTRRIEGARSVDACDHHLIKAATGLVVAVAVHMEGSLLLPADVERLDLEERSIAVNAALSLYPGLIQGPIH